MPTIDSITQRRILNSHVAFTTEFTVLLDNGARGLGAAAEGETISIYEDRLSTDPAVVICAIRGDGLMDRPISQEEFDDYLTARIGVFGRNMCFALSLAFYSAEQLTLPAGRNARQDPPLAAPRICCNILNGGRHAYTNPVLSDFPEYLLVSRSDDIEEVIGRHDAIQQAVQAALGQQPKAVVSGNSVSRFATADNRECIEFVLGIRDRLGFAHDFDLMVDASAGDLWDGDGYRLSITDGSVHSRESFCDYWLDLLGQYSVRYLEDPFSEEDGANWSRLAQSQKTSLLIGDNLYSSDAERIAHGSAGGWTHGVVVKPNQAGTITAVSRSFEMAKRCGQIAVASHRSISTESTIVAALACRFDAEYIKVGPLLTDYSAVMRVNEILRLST